MIVLIGMMGSGKSSVGRMLARELGTPAIDLDREIERRAALSVAEVFSVFGEAHFRRLEEEELCAVAERTYPCVLSLGGGAVMSERGMLALRAKAKRIIYLQTPIAELLRRLRRSPIRRPLLENTSDPAGRLAELLAVRGPLYEYHADFVVDTDGKRLSAVAQEILDRLAHRQGGVFSEQQT